MIAFWPDPPWEWEAMRLVPEGIPESDELATSGISLGIALIEVGGAEATAARAHATIPDAGVLLRAIVGVGLAKQGRSTLGTFSA